MEISSRTATTHKPLRLRGCVAICAAIVVSAFSLSGAATASASAPRAVRLPAATFPVITQVEDQDRNSPRRAEQLLGARAIGGSGSLKTIGCPCQLRGTAHSYL